MNFQTTRTGTNIIKQFYARGDAQIQLGQETCLANQMAQKFRNMTQLIDCKFQ